MESTFRGVHIVKLLKFSFLILPVLFLSQLFSQTAGNDFSIEITILNEEKLQTLYLSDLDLQNFGTAEELFEITVTKNSREAYDNCYFVIKLIRDNELLVTAKSDLFTIPADFITKTANNLELSGGGFSFGEDPSTEVRFNETTINPSAEKLRDEILSSGKAPFGIYKLSVELYQKGAPAALAAQEKILLKATNPSYLHLVTPGAPAGSGQSANIYSQFPIFQWNGNGTEYQLMVFEKKEMMQSYDDIINSQPNWVSDRTGALSLQYPQSGSAIPLEFNKTYYWMVRMFIQSSSGEEFIDSEIWEFTLVNPEQGEDLQNQIVQEDILQFLSRLLGPRIEEIKASLEGYQLKRIKYNGEEITINKLYEILNSYRGKSFEIVEFIPPEQ